MGLQGRFGLSLFRAVLRHADVMRDAQRGNVEARNNCLGIHCEPTRGARSGYTRAYAECSTTKLAQVPG
jgi:hypothetical protein